jgi:hypothetical protein
MATIVEESAALVVSIVPPSCPCIENYDSSELYITQAMKVISIADPDRCTRNSSVFKVDGLVLGEGSKEHQICNCILSLFLVPCPCMETMVVCFGSFCNLPTIMRCTRTHKTLQLTACLQEWKISRSVTRD